MARTINPTLLTILQSSTPDLYIAVEMLFDSGPIRIWSGLGNKTINSNTYTGVGNLLTITGMSENLNLSAENANVVISGVDSGNVSLALQEPYQNRICKIYLGSGSDVVEIFSGFMDVMTIQDSGETSTINITVESKLIMLDRIVPRRYTNETQTELYANDTFFSYVEDLQDKTVVWGRKE